MKKLEHGTPAEVVYRELQEFNRKVGDVADKLLPAQGIEFEVLRRQMELLFATGTRKVLVQGELKTLLRIRKTVRQVKRTGAI